MRTWTINADHDIRVASWNIADLLLGPDDGSIERDDIECHIQQVITESFTETEGRDPVCGPVDPNNPPSGSDTLEGGVTNHER
jgi:hypothetical protein